MIVRMEARKRLCTLWLTVVVLCSALEADDAVTTPVAQNEHEPDSRAPEDSPEDSAVIREKRHFRSRQTVWRVLRWPADALDYLWHPLRLGLDYSEEIRLEERVEEAFFFNDEHTAGWFPKPSFGGPLGDAGGASVFFEEAFRERDRLDVSVLAAGKREFDVHGSYAIVPDEHEPFHVKLDAGFIRDREVEVYVTTDGAGNSILGMDTDEREESAYQHLRFFTGLTLGVELFGEMDLSCHVRGELSKASQRPAVTITRLSGFDEEINLIAPGFVLEWDRRDDVRRPQRGWLVQAGADAAASPVKSDRGNRFGYVDTTLDAQVFLPLHGPHRVLVLRQRLRRVDDWGGYDLTFYHLPVLDLNHGLRAYDRNRFQDNGSIVTNFEYRYPIWKTWDGFLFVDGGQTFSQYSDVELRDFEYAGGGGIRLMTQKDIEFILQIGFGSEGEEVVFSFDRVLQ
jgi:hypothetical protein